MTTLAFMLLMQVAQTQPQTQPQTQFLVSTKAGIVNYVQGAANVKPATSVPAGKPITTGPGGAVEILLNPGSYLRMGENSEVLLERVELSDIVLRIVKGSAVIEASGVDKDLPLAVNSGKLEMQIIKDGIYLFADGKVVVVDGKVRDAGNNGLVYGKGYQISDDKGYRAQKVKTFTTQLELWSQKRGEQIARANLNIANSLNQNRNIGSSFLDVWLWAPGYASFIYMPGGRYRSPYGYRYRMVGETYYGGGSRAASESTGGGNNGGGFNSGNSGGGNSGGGGGAPATFSSGVPASTGASSPTPSAGAQAGAPSGAGRPTLGK
jgi:hypothetical protein